MFKKFSTLGRNWS